MEKALEGCNVNLCVLGSTGSGADTVLEGMPGAPKDDEQSQGLILLAIQALFNKLQKRSIEVWSAEPAKNFMMKSHTLADVMWQGH